MRKVVKHKPSGRLVYREDPDFQPGLGLKNAAGITGLDIASLAEIDATEQEWQTELAQREIERPRTDRELIVELTANVRAIENEIGMASRPLGMAAISKASKPGLLTRVKSSLGGLIK